MRRAWHPFFNVLTWRYHRTNKPRLHIPQARQDGVGNIDMHVDCCLGFCLQRSCAWPCRRHRYLCSLYIPSPQEGNQRQWSCCDHVDTFRFGGLRGAMALIVSRRQASNSVVSRVRSGYYDGKGRLRISRPYLCISCRKKLRKCDGQ